LKERFLTKIGMSRTFYPLDEASQKQLVKPHTNRGAITEHWEFASLGAAGALRSNTLEMLEFLKFWTNENGDSTLEKARKKALSVQYSDEDIALAYGWMYSNLNKDSEQKIYWHNGGTGGFRTFTGFVEGQKKGVIIMSNTSNQVDDAGMAILRIL
jgi:CubicO group peptidase (beta-lactamase class C family)